jgi:hypothetical protein
MDVEGKGVKGGTETGKTGRFNRFFCSLFALQAGTFAAAIWPKD